MLQQQDADIVGLARLIQLFPRIPPVHRLICAIYRNRFDGEGTLR